MKEEIQLKFRQYEESLSVAKSQRKEVCSSDNIFIFSDSLHQTQNLYKSVEIDRRKLMNEITEQNKLVDTLSREKTCK